MSNMSMVNRKPFRTKEQKAQARATAVKVDGTWRSNAPVSYHDAKKKKRAE